MRMQALMTLAAFNSSSLCLRFIFLYRLRSLLRFLLSEPCLFGHRFFAFFLGPVFVRHIITNKPCTQREGMKRRKPTTLLSDISCSCCMLLDGSWPYPSLSSEGRSLTSCQYSALDEAFFKASSRSAFWSPSSQSSSFLPGLCLVQYDWSLTCASHL